jgi:hypothetical protein
MSQPFYSGLQFYSTYPTPLLLTSNAVPIRTTPSNNIMRSSQSKTLLDSTVTFETSRRLMQMNMRGVHNEVVGAQCQVTNVVMTSYIAKNGILLLAYRAFPDKNAKTRSFPMVVFINAVP